MLAMYSEMTYNDEGPKYIKMFSKESYMMGQVISIYYYICYCITAQNYPKSSYGNLMHAVIDTFENNQHAVQGFLQFFTPFLTLTIV